MKRLSILLTLALMGQSAFGGLKIQEWANLLGTLKSEARCEDETSLRAFEARLCELQKYLAEINPNGDSMSLEYVYDSLMALKTGTTEIKWKNLSKEDRLTSKELLQDMVSELKDKVNTDIKAFSFHGRMINAATSAKNKAFNGVSYGLSTAIDGVSTGASAVKFGVCHPIETAQLAGSKLAYGASVGVILVNDHKKAAATLAGAAVLGAAAYNREALKEAGLKAVAFVKENAPKAAASAKENASYFGSYLTEKSKNIGSRLSNGYDWAYDTKPVIASRIAMYNGIDRAAELMAAHPTALYRTKIAAGSAATVGSALATVKAYKAYKAYKAAKLEAQKALLKKAYNLNDEVC